MFDFSFDLWIASGGLFLTSAHCDTQKNYARKFCRIFVLFFFNYGVWKQIGIQRFQLQCCPSFVSWAYFNANFFLKFVLGEGTSFQTGKLNMSESLQGWSCSSACTPPQYCHLPRCTNVAFPQTFTGSGKVGHAYKKFMQVSIYWNNTTSLANCRKRSGFFH